MTFFIFVVLRKNIFVKAEAPSEIFYLPVWFYYPLPSSHLTAAGQCFCTHVKTGVGNWMSQRKKNNNTKSKPLDFDSFDTFLIWFSMCLQKNFAGKVEDALEGQEQPTSKKGKAPVPEITVNPQTLNIELYYQYRHCCICVYLHFLLISCYSTFYFHHKPRGYWLNTTVFDNILFVL